MSLHMATFTFGVIGSAVLLVCGCGKAHQRHSITGSVTLDGKPLENGQITFVPQLNTSGPTAGGSVINGKFDIPAEHGVFAGNFRVEIVASRPTGNKSPDRFTGELTEEVRQIIPRRFNADSTLQAEVKSSEGNHFEFAISSR